MVARELDARNFNLRACSSTLFNVNIYNIFSFLFVRSYYETRIFLSFHLDEFTVEEITL